MLVPTVRASGLPKSPILNVITIQWCDWYIQNRWQTQPRSNSTSEAPLHVENKIKCICYSPPTGKDRYITSLTWNITLETKIYCTLLTSAIWMLHLSNQHCDMWYPPAATKSPSMLIFNCYDKKSTRKCAASTTTELFLCVFLLHILGTNSHCQAVHWTITTFCAMPIISNAGNLCFMLV